MILNAHIYPPAPLYTALTLLLVGTSLSGCGDDIAVSTSDSASSGEGSSSTSETSETSETSATDTASTGSGSDSDSDSDSGESDSAGSTGSTSESSSSGSDSSTTTTGTSSSTGGSTSTSTTGGLSSCVDDDLPYAGALCGPEDDACEVSINEAVESEHHYRNESPAVTFDNLCDPQVLYSVAEGGYHGFFSARAGDQDWPVAKTPFEIARIGLAYDHNEDATLALTYDGAFGTSLWSHTGGAWQEIDAMPGKQTASSHGFARDPAGPLHAAVVTDSSEPRHAIYDGNWSSESLGEQSPASVAVSLDGAGAPHLSFWSSTDQTWKLYYAAPPEPAEEILALGSNLLNIQRQGIAAVPGDGQPLETAALALAAVQTAGGLHRLVLATRLSPGKWKVETIVAEDDKNAVLCEQQPQSEGDLCDYDYIRYLPLEILASAGGDARFFYRQTHYIGTLVAECVQLPMPACFWIPLSNENTGELRIGWPTDSGPAWTTVLDDVFFTDMSATIDTEGRIHIAAYDTENTSDTMVRYLQLE